MKKLLTYAVIAIGATLTAAAQTTAHTFNWASPGSLSPAYPAPTADNRYGEYISNVTFTAGPVQFTIDDNAVKEQSQRARFLYGYLTGTVEMRAYPNSVLTIEVPQDAVIESIIFEGAKADDNYMSYEGAYGTLEGNTWTAAPGAHVHTVLIDIDTTINCTRTTVNTAVAAVTDVTADADGNPGTWYTLQGVPLQAEPLTPGLYIFRQGSRASLRLIEH